MFRTHDLIATVIRADKESVVMTRWFQDAVFVPVFDTAVSFLFRFVKFAVPLVADAAVDQGEQGKPWSSGWSIPCTTDRCVALSIPGHGLDSSLPNQGSTCVESVSRGNTRVRESLRG